MLFAEVGNAGVVIGGVVKALLNKLVPVSGVTDHFCPVLHPEREASADLHLSVRLVYLRALLVDARIGRVADQYIGPPDVWLLEPVILRDGHSIRTKLLDVGRHQFVCWPLQLYDQVLVLVLSRFQGAGKYEVRDRGTAALPPNRLKAGQVHILAQQMEVGSQDLCQAVIVAGQRPFLPEDPGLVGQDPMQLPAFQRLLLCCRIEDEGVQPGQEVQAVGDSLGSLDDTGKCRPAEQSPQFCDLVFGQLQNVEQDVLQGRRTGFERCPDQAQRQLSRASRTFVYDRSRGQRHDVERLALGSLCRSHRLAGVGVDAIGLPLLDQLFLLVGRPSLEVLSDSVLRGYYQVTDDPGVQFGQQDIVTDLVKSGPT